MKNVLPQSHRDREKHRGFGFKPKMHLNSVSLRLRGENAFVFMLERLGIRGAIRHLFSA